MYTTIEPRLIALLNRDLLSEPSASPSLELPSIRDSNILNPSGRPLLLQSDASHSNSPLAANAPHRGNSTGSADQDVTPKRREAKKTGKQNTERALGNSSPQSLRKILDHDDGSITSTLLSKKREAPAASKDEFVQLPQPPKKQKAAQQVVPPIIIGLFEPPPQATLFPPIASSSFHDSHGRNSLNSVIAKVAQSTDQLKLDEAAFEVEKEQRPISDTKKNVRVRRRWSEEETKNLLLGVSKHGVGSWADILEDSAFTFNNRSGVDLKDRFRTCYPVEPRYKSLNSKPSGPSRDRVQNPGKSTSSLMSENILIDDDKLVHNNPTVGSKEKLQRSNRTHRKKLEDLRELGIDRPFRKSQRRERNLFTDEEDREILEGYNLYGPAWTRIHRNPHFHLQSRQPTDLRDRFRNKFPEKFKSDDGTKGNLQAELLTKNQSGEVFPSALLIRERDAAITTSQSALTFGTFDREENGLVSDNPVSMNNIKVDVRENDIVRNAMDANLPALNLHLSASRERLKIQQMISIEQQKPQSLLHLSTKDLFTPFSEQIRTTEPTDDLSYSQTFDWGSSIAAPFAGNIGEMDISRLLMDDPWIENISTRERQNFTDISSILSSSAEPLSSGQSFYILDPEQMNNIHASASSDHDSSYG